MSQRAQRQCSIEMAKWKNALQFYDLIRTDAVPAPGADCFDARPSMSLLTDADRTVGNVACGLISSQIAQGNAVMVVRDCIYSMQGYGRFMSRVFSEKRAINWIAS